MDLWIRNQDGIRLKKVSEVYFDEVENLRDEECNILGTYKSQERALEILNEIQNILKDSQYGYKVN